MTKHSNGSDQFTYELNERLGDGSDSGPGWADDCFYLSGKLEAFDAPTEWYHDARSSTLYLWCDDGRSPAAHRVAVKRRTLEHTRRKAIVPKGPCWTYPATE